VARQQAAGSGGGKREGHLAYRSMCGSGGKIFAKMSCGVIISGALDVIIKAMKTSSRRAMAGVASASAGGISSISNGWHGVACTNARIVAQSKHKWQQRAYGAALNVA